MEILKRNKMILGSAELRKNITSVRDEFEEESAMPA